MKESEFFALAADLLSKSLTSIDTTSRLDEVGWDSLCLLSLIAEVDASMGLSIELAEVHKAITLGDLWACVRADDD